LKKLPTPFISQQPFTLFTVAARIDRYHISITTLALVLPFYSCAREIVTFRPLFSRSGAAGEIFVLLVCLHFSGVHV